MCVKEAPVESRGAAVVDPNSSLVAPTFVMMCATLAGVAVVRHCMGSRYMVVGSQAGAIVVALAFLAFLAFLACTGTLRTGSAWAYQSCDRKIGSLGNSVYLLVFQSYHFQARDLSLEPHGGVIEAPKKEARRKVGQEVEGSAWSALNAWAHHL